MRWLLVLPPMFFLVISTACLDNEEPVRDTEEQQTLQAGPQNLPHDRDQPAAGLPDLLNEHLEEEFSDRDWVDDVQKVEEDGTRLRVTLGIPFEGNEQDFDEACTAAAGFAISENDFGIDRVEVAEEDGDLVARTNDGMPQCYRISG